MADTEFRFTITTGDKNADNELFVALQGIEGVRVEQDCYKALSVPDAIALGMVCWFGRQALCDAIAGIISLQAIRAGYPHVIYNGRSVLSDKLSLLGAIHAECHKDDKTQAKDD